MRGGAVILLGACASPALALSDADLRNLTEVFHNYCLTPLMEAQEPSEGDMRLPSGDAGFGYSGSVTQDDRVMFNRYEDRGLWGCGTVNSVYTVPADGPDYARLVAALDLYADALAQNQDFAETTACLPKIDGSWARSFTTQVEARPGTNLSVLVSSTSTYSNGGVSLQEHYGPVKTRCEAAQ